VVNPILCVGSHPNDVAQLLTVARHLQEQTGVGAVFSTVAPEAVAAQVRDQVAAAGYPILDRPVAIAAPRDERNPLRRARRWRDENRAAVEHVVAEVQPSALLATVNPLPCLLLDGAAQRGVPSVLLQLWTMGDRSFRRAWRADDRRFAAAAASWKRRVRQHLERGAEMAFGVCDPLEWMVRDATIAVEGSALRRQLIDDGVPGELVVVTGNPGLDDLHALAQYPDAARTRVRAQLGVPDGRAVVTHFRSHEDRFPKIDPRTRREAQTTVIRALRDGAPGATVVVKLHPKELDSEREIVRSIDADVIVAGTDVDANELIAASELVVGMFSTTLLQAVALDRPAVGATLWPDLDYWCRMTDWSGVDRADGGAALTEVVRRSLTDPDYQQRWAARRAEFAQDRFRLDGHGTQRIVELIERMLRPQAGCPS
jgi:hypothetical protein